MSARRLPLGAEIMDRGGVHFRVWAPAHRTVDVVIEGGPGERGSHRLEAEPNGWFSGSVSDAAAGTLYRFRLDDRGPFPDPASRFQPDGPHGPSQVIDPFGYAWQNDVWPGIDRAAPNIIYELHVGTFTAGGTFESAQAELPALADLGITIIEVMPIADFPGRFGWGYDGVNLYAPTRLYGEPDDFRRFIDRAHELGISVILDVVYNHFGPDGNYLTEFSPDYFTDRYECDWGQAVNFDGPNAEGVRELVGSNAVYWCTEFHLDGLRLDATQQIFDASPVHIITDICHRTRSLETGRRIFLVAENEPQDSRWVVPGDRGCALDALWNDDFHHTAMVALTGRREAYYKDYLGSAQELVSCAKHGFLYQGQYYSWQKGRRGTADPGLSCDRMVNYIQNHDQVANSVRGERIHQIAGAARIRAMTALTMLMPGIPMLFQGQEFAASSRFLFFADHKPDLADQVRVGRVEFMTQFQSVAETPVKSILDDPADPATFEQCKLDWSERGTNQHVVSLHTDLIRLRKDDAAFHGQHAARVDGAVLTPSTFVLRFFREDPTQDRLLLVNLDVALYVETLPEPLLAPPFGMRWDNHWSSEDAQYDGGGTPTVERDDGWAIPAECAVLLVPASRS
jgi:maltooligosyltrehalose trehalohydrolase